MPLSNKPFADWTKEDLDALIADPPAVETARLDFKADCKLLSKDKDEKENARRDILVDISAMANGAGGALLIGVRQSGKPGAPPFAEKIEGVEDVERLKQTIKDLVNTHLDVRPGSLEYRVILYEDDLSVLIVEVPANTYCLSMITHNQCNQFRIRRGTDNRFMTTDEIEYKFGQFAKVRDSASDELEKIRSQLRQSEIRPMVWFAGVPIARLRDHIPVNIQAIREIVTNSSYFSACPSRQNLPSDMTPASRSQFLEPSLRGVGISRQYEDRVVFEIRRDGVVVIGQELPLGTREVETVQGISILFVYEPLLSSLHLFADIQDRFGIGKVALVQAGLMEVGEKTISEAPFCHLHQFKEADIPLDATLWDEHLSPKDVFMQWATQLANALGLERPILRSPWLDDKKD